MGTVSGVAARASRTWPSRMSSPPAPHRRPRSPAVGRRSSRRAVAALAFLLGPAAAAPGAGAAAQEAAAAETPTRDAADPFEYIRPRAGPGADVYRGDLQEFWRPGPVLEVGAETPFYLGSLEAGLMLGSHDARPSDLPDFDTRYLYVGWGIEHPLPLGVTWRNGARIGFLNMKFDTEAVPPPGRDESEIGIGATTTLRRAFVGRWHVSASARYRTVYTRRRLHQLFLSVAVGRSFDTPGWLRDFLR